MKTFNEVLTESSDMMPLSVYYKDYDSKVINTSKEIDNIISSLKNDDSSIKNRLLDLITNLVDDCIANQSSDNIIK